jgi:methylphosphotriester-DNA--protein-cysteine methyltransferase
MRMSAALKQVASGKIDAIALQVGYRSRKNFNEAFRKVTPHAIGLPPADARARQ